MINPNQVIVCYVSDEVPNEIQQSLNYAIIHSGNPPRESWYPTEKSLVDTLRSGRIKPQDVLFSIPKEILRIERREVKRPPAGAEVPTGDRACWVQRAIPQNPQIHIIVRYEIKGAEQRKILSALEI